MQCISISHKKADAAIRSCFALSMTEQEQLREKIFARTGIDGIVILCTCNRFELYYSTKETRQLRQMQETLATYKNRTVEELLPYINCYVGDQAIIHLFKVCSGLESKILGEDEILHQAKQAFLRAKEMGHTSYEINVIFQHAITAAKKGKAETKVSKEAVSIATLVGNEVHQFHKGDKKNVLIIGITGKIASDTAKNLLSRKNITIRGTVRSHNSFFDYVLTNERIKLVEYKTRYDNLSWADVVISATASPHYTITYEEAKQREIESKERLLIDLAIPRDIDPAMKNISGTTLRNIDYFETVSKEHQLVKGEEIKDVRLILQNEINITRKELLFHAYLHKIPEWQRDLEEIGLNKFFYQIKKHMEYEEMEAVLHAFDGIKLWKE